MIADPGPVNSTSERVRRYRDRRQRGARICPVELSDSHIDWLIKKGLLTSQDRDDRERVANALFKFVEAGFQRDRLNENPWHFSAELLPSAIEHMIGRGWLAASARFDRDSVQWAFQRLVQDALSRR